MEPSGNAKAAATDSRSGVSGLISSRAGTAQRIADLNFKNMPDGRVTQRGGFVLRGAADCIAPGQQELARTHPEAIPSPHRRRQRALLFEEADAQA